jgi:hypothetical protein
MKSSQKTLRSRRSLYGFEGANALKADICPDIRNECLKDRGKQDIMSDRAGNPNLHEIRQGRISGGTPLTIA